VAGRVLDRAVTVIRERRAWRHERHVHSAQARTSARVLTLLPLGFALWGLLTSPSVRTAYATSPVVIAVAATGIALNVAGWWWMRHVVNGAS
jgi:Flp pilus assembly protein TadB